MYLDILIYMVPFPGFAIGAIMPPLLFKKAPCTAIFLNILGFLLYAWSAWFIIGGLNYDELCEGDSTSFNLMTIAAGVFFIAVEALTLLHTCRKCTSIHSR